MNNGLGKNRDSMNRKFGKNEDSTSNFERFSLKKKLRVSAKIKAGNFSAKVTGHVIK